MDTKRLKIVLLIFTLLFTTVGTSEASESVGENKMAWIGSNNYLGTNAQRNNARIIYDYLLNEGWSVNAICAVLGNMQSESTINPNIWEYLIEDTTRGYGLVQWTPATKLITWCVDNGLSYTDGYAQLQRIIYEAENGIQWFENPQVTPSQPPITFKQFTKSTLDITVLANYWCWYYEHPYEPNQPNRGTQALAWYEYLTGEQPPQPPMPPIPIPTTKDLKKMPVWMMCKKYTLTLK